MIRILIADDEEIECRGLEMMLQNNFQDIVVLPSVYNGVDMVKCVENDKPDLLIADEPTTALDVTIQAQILELMRQLQEELSTSMILITHDLGIVVEICTKVAVIYSGQIIESGTVEDVYTRKFNHPYTEGLFKCIPDLKTNAPRLTPIQGNMADPENLPKGCKFYDRCGYRTEKCAGEEPGFYMKGSHGIKCYKFEDGWGEEDGCTNY